MVIFHSHYCTQFIMVGKSLINMTRKLQINNIQHMCTFIFSMISKIFKYCFKMCLQRWWKMYKYDTWMIFGSKFSFTPKTTFWNFAKNTKIWLRRIIKIPEYQNERLVPRHSDFWILCLDAFNYRWETALFFVCNFFTNLNFKIDFRLKLLILLLLFK